MEDRFVTEVHGDEIKLNRVDCSKGICDCSESLPDSRCGMTAAKAQEFVAQYYQMKADYIRGMTRDAFLLDFAGIYPT